MPNPISIMDIIRAGGALRSDVNAAAAISAKNAAVAAAALMATKVEIIPGPSRFVVLDPQGNGFQELGLGVFSNVAFNALAAAYAALPKNSLALREIIPGPSRELIMDPNGNGFFEFGANGINNLDYNTTKANAAAGAVSARPRSRVRIVSELCGAGNEAGTLWSNGGSQITASYGIQFKVDTDCTALQFIYEGGTCDSSYQTNPIGNALRLAVAVQTSAVMSPVSIGAPDGTKISANAGARTANVIGDGDIKTSGIIAGVFRGDGTTYSVVNHVKVAAGERWPLNMNTGMAAWVGGFTSDAVYGTTVTDGRDLTYDPATSHGNYAPTAYVLGPLAVIGKQTVDKSIVGVCGDSTGKGNGAMVNCLGSIGRAVKAAGYGLRNFSQGGTTPAQISVLARKLAELSKFVDHWIMVTGINPLNTGTAIATIKADILNALVYLSTQENQVGWSLPLASPTSTDGFVTYVNQNVFGQEANRVTLCNWGRDPTPTGFYYALSQRIGANRIIGTTGIFDPNPALERDSAGNPVVLSTIGGIPNQQAAGVGGYILINATPNRYTSDGTHRNDNGQIAEAAVVQAAVTANCDIPTR